MGKILEEIQRRDKKIEVIFKKYMSGEISIKERIEMCDKMDNQAEQEILDEIEKIIPKKTENLTYGWRACVDEIWKRFYQLRGGE